MGVARKRQLDAVLVWRFDRFARSTKHLLLALEEFRSLGIQFISYQENIDTTSPLGQALFTIVSAVAQLERALIRERVKAGLRNAKLKGKTLGRPTLTWIATVLPASALQVHPFAKSRRSWRYRPRQSTRRFGSVSKTPSAALTL
jgi:DNA invertase Pin-like site-specific DNA recombinase